MPQLRDVILLLTLFIAGFLLLRRPSWAARLETPFFLTLQLAVLALSAALLLFEIIASSFLPQFVDHISPQIAAASWALLNGQPLYPNWRNGEGFYGMLYGPLIYEYQSIFLVLSPPLLASKLSGVFAFLTALVVTSIAIFRRRTFLWVDGVILGYGIILLGGSLNYEFWNRPEPVLILLAAVALIAHQSERAALAAIVIGACMGLATGLKVHGAVYIMPMAVGLLLKQGTPASRIKVLILGFVGATAGAALPWLAPGAGFDDLLQYMQLAAGHGLSADLLIKSAVFGVVIAAPLLLLLPSVGLSPDKAIRGVLYTTVLCLLITAVVAAKPGSGPHHLFPFILPMCWLATRQAEYRKSRDPRNAQAPVLMGACLLCAALGYAKPWIEFARLTSRHIQTAALEKLKIDELRELYRRAPDASMGVADVGTYEDTYYRLVGLDQGSRLVFDIAAWMDIAFGKQSGSKSILPLAVGCRVPHWIVPAKEAPFSLRSPYDGQPLFPPEFIEAFKSNYVRTVQGSYYDVWSCHGARVTRDPNENMLGLPSLADRR